MHLCHITSRICIIQSTFISHYNYIRNIIQSRSIMQQSHTNITSLVTSYTTFNFNDLWYNLSEMANVFCTLSNIHCIPKSNYGCHKFILCVRLGFSSDILFWLMPQVLYRVDVGRLRWCLPLVHLIFLQPSSCEMCNMLRVILLHETVVAVTKLIMQER